MIGGPGDEQPDGPRTQPVLNPTDQRDDVFWEEQWTPMDEARWTGIQQTQVKDDEWPMLQEQYHVPSARYLPRLQAQARKETAGQGEGSESGAAAGAIIAAETQANTESSKGSNAGGQEHAP